jgi:SAM-dependent methyltransferase
MWFGMSSRMISWIVRYYMDLMPKSVIQPCIMSIIRSGQSQKRKHESVVREMNKIHEANRVFWNKTSEEWVRRTDERGIWHQCHRDPALVLTPGEIRFLEDIYGKNVCVLGSGDNEVVFALAGMGARVTSVDISEAQLKIAAQRAETLGLEVAFLRADVTELDELGDKVFEVVYTGGHVSVWVSDLQRYYAEAVRILRSGGIFIVNEYHPFRRVWKDETDDLVLHYNYFDRGPFEDTSTAGLIQVEYHWTVSDHIQAVLDAGCELSQVAEHGQGFDEWRKTDLRCLPEYLLIIGRKLQSGKQP